MVKAEDKLFRYMNENEGDPEAVGLDELDRLSDDLRRVIDQVSKLNRSI